MPKQMELAAKPFAKKARRFECRVYQRLPCDLAGFCQPAALQGSQEARWPATVRDISQSGVNLQLKRRYEAGTGLAIELPVKGAGEPCSYFVKVVRLKPMTDGFWSLGCQFISPLSEDELQKLLGNADQGFVSEVQFLVSTKQGKLLRCRIKRLRLPLPWPPPPGKSLVIRGGTTTIPPWTLKVQVIHCKPQGQHWVLRCLLLEPQAAGEVMRLLGDQSTFA